MIPINDNPLAFLCSVVAFGMLFFFGYVWYHAQSLSQRMAVTIYFVITLIIFFAAAWQLNPFK